MELYNYFDFSGNSPYPHYVCNGIDGKITVYASFLEDVYRTRLEC